MFGHSSGRLHEAGIRRHTMQVYRKKQAVEYYSRAMYKTFYHGGPRSNTHNAAGIILGTQDQIVPKTRGINNTSSDIFEHAESKSFTQLTRKFHCGLLFSRLRIRRNSIRLAF